MVSSSTCQRMEFVDEKLRHFFYHLGRLIGLHPGYFLIVPVLLTALCATGLQTIFYESDPEYLFSPVNGPAKLERKIVESTFDFNYSNFDPIRITRVGRFGQIFVQDKHNISTGNLLKTNTWNQILLLDEIIRNLTINWKGHNYTYNELCAETDNGLLCWDNTILNIGHYMNQIESKEIKVNYPVWFDPETFEKYPIFLITGGVQLESDNITVKSFHSVLLNYFLKSESEEDIQIGAMWEDAFLKTLEIQNFSDISVSRFTSLTIEKELEANTNSVIPYFSLNIGLMIAFSIVTCMMSDWVKSKPILGLFGVISAMLATISAFGFVMYCGMPFIGINLAGPFLMLGIGIDDTFVLLGAWRRSSLHNSVEERMGQTFKEAAVSITITSVTDMFSFWIGVITPFPCVKIFCVYTGCCVVFTYVWHITFFGACMTIAGYAEKQNRHAITCLPVLPKSQSDGKGFFYNVFCNGGVSELEPYNKKDNVENGAMVFFRDYFAFWLNKSIVKFFVLIIFVVYTAISLWGISQLKEGLERQKLSRYDSYSADFFEIEKQYFKKYPYRINVVLNDRLNYSDTETQDEIELLMRSLEKTTYVDHRFSESWLRDFLGYVDRVNSDTEYRVNISNEKTFVSMLRDNYLGSGDNSLLKDIIFENDSIRASRFFIQGYNVISSNDERMFVEDLRRVCDASKLNVTVFHPLFIYFDQFIIVLPTTIQSVVTAAAIMMAISLIFIPNPMCSIWVAFSIISIEVGVLGFMTLWGVSLDAISMINLIMSIGFSVDFTAHISYHYMTQSKKSCGVLTPPQRLSNSLYALGLPIVQGAISTILGVSGLTIAPSYIFITFFKMIFLVITFGALHGIILLPVLLSVLGPGSCSRNKDNPNYENSETKDSEYNQNKLNTDFSSNQHSENFNHNNAESMLQLRIPRPSTSMPLALCQPKSNYPPWLLHNFAKNKYIHDNDQISIPGRIPWNYFFGEGSKSLRSFSSQNYYLKHCPGLTPSNSSSPSSGSTIMQHEVYRNKAFDQNWEENCGENTVNTSTNCYSSKK